MWLLIFVTLAVGGTVAAWGYAKIRGVGVTTVFEEVIRGEPNYEVLAGTPLNASIVRRYDSALLDEPIDVAELPDSSLLIALKGGALIRLDPVSGGVQAVLDIRTRVLVSTEQGLLAVAVHPKFGIGGESRVFITYVGIKDGWTRLDVIHIDPKELTVVGPLQTLFTYPHFNLNHMAADLEFTAAGNLLVSTGDSGGSGDPERSAQDPTSLLGKILEIDLNANPVVPVNRAIGVRNPWKISTEPRSGALWIADVGQDGVEEISVLTTRPTDVPVNFGWPIMEGNTCYATLSCELPAEYVPPRSSYAHTKGRCSVIGAAFSQEYFLFADYCTGELFAIPSDAAPATEPTAVVWVGKRPRLMPTALYSDRRGRVWILDQLNSRVFQVAISR